jgi:hypothetical protein
MPEPHAPKRANLFPRAVGKHEPLQMFTFVQSAKCSNDRHLLRASRSRTPPQAAGVRNGKPERNFVHEQTIRVPMAQLCLPASQLLHYPAESLVAATIRVLRSGHVGKAG